MCINKDISKYLVKKFGNLSGYAQQYLYDYMLKNNNIYMIKKMKFYFFILRKQLK